MECGSSFVSHCGSQLMSGDDVATLLFFLFFLLLLLLRLSTGSYVGDLLRR